ncbi:MAG: competence protein [Candidatus Saganbacteria bacterium]|nr:competence protein [Candidatus Saganbacteria bacterium]
MKFKFALVNGDKTEAQPGLRGACAYCQSEMIAKCGQVRIPHWAHKSNASCDPWWENETEWHRTWKNHFPTGWQEITHKDSTTGERHIADIKTDKEFVIEFQHSAIKSEEIKSREEFYKNMVWVVDGSCRKNDYSRFCKGYSGLRFLSENHSFLSTSPETCFPAGWLTSSVPVYFDFQGIFQANQTDVDLWCLFPERVDGYAIIACVSRKQFVELSSNAPSLLRAQKLISDTTRLILRHKIAAQRVDPLITILHHARAPRRGRRSY